MTVVPRFTVIVSPSFLRTSVASQLKTLPGSAWFFAGSALSATMNVAFGASSKSSLIVTVFGAAAPRGDSIDTPFTFSQQLRAFCTSTHSPSSDEPAREEIMISTTARSPAASGPVQYVFGTTPPSSEPASAALASFVDGRLAAPNAPLSGSFSAEMGCS
jgi:hypothetical protein